MAGSEAAGLSPALRCKRLEDAVKSFHRALAEARQPGEWCSARKNLSLAHMKWAALLVGMAGEEEVIESRLTEQQERIMYHFREACGEIKEVLQSGPRSAASVMGDEWCRHLEERAHQVYQACLDWALERCATAQAAAALLRRLAARLPTQELCVRCRFDEAETIFVLCTREITPGRRLGHATLLSQLPDCEKPLREALAGATRIRSLAQMDACQALLESVQLEMCVARASQAIDFGDRVLWTALHDFETLSMDGVWEAVDFYHEAIAQAKEKDIESEARANSQLGSVYKDVLKIKSRAKKHFSRSMELATTLMPRNLHGTPWFDKAAAALEAFQADAVHRSDKETQAKKQPLLDELREELGALRKAREEGGLCGLLEHLYAAHPPRGGGTRDSDADCKKQVLHAIRHYHPDKSVTRSFEEARPLGDEDKTAARDADRWVVLCEEITKLLNTVWDEEFKKGRGG